MPSLERDGRRISYDREGVGDPALLFIHGATCDRSHFSPQLEEFASRHTSVSLDLEGHGESDRASGQASIDRYADDVAWAIKALGLERPIAVGHSMGGLVALRLATTRPCPIRGAVTIDPAPLMITDQLSSALTDLAASVEGGDLEPLRAFIAHTWFVASSPADLKARIVEATMAAPERAVATIRAVLGHDVLRSGTVEVPHLVINTERPINTWQQVHELLPNAVYGQVVGGGHFAMQEAPIQVNDMIARFVEYHLGDQAVRRVPRGSPQPHSGSTK